MKNKKVIQICGLKFHYRVKPEILVTSKGIGMTTAIIQTLLSRW